jgi:NAD(P)-dependent dehydrogenase (short-subunit alcohol dehydrogenase family)
MPDSGAVVVVGGTRAIGLEIVKHFAARGEEVILTGRDEAHVDEAVKQVAGNVRGLKFDLAHPKEISPGLADVGKVKHLVLAAIDRDQNTVAEYDIERALYLVTLKLVGFTEVVHTLRGRLDEGSSIVLFGGMAKERPYPGSTTVSTVNGGVVGLTRSLVEELKPIRVNAIHPGVVEDSPYWAGKTQAIENYTSQTPLGRLAHMDEIVDAVVFLLENGAVNGVDLIVDGGWHCR